MVTVPTSDDKPTLAQRFDPRARQAVLLALAAAIVALAPLPFGSLGAAALVLVALGVRR